MLITHTRIYFLRVQNSVLIFSLQLIDISSDQVVAKPINYHMSAALRLFYVGSQGVRYYIHDYSVAIFLSEVYTAIVSGFSSAISLIQTYWGDCPFLPEGYRERPQTTVPLYLSSSGEPQMPISAQILQLFILVLIGLRPETSSCALAFRVMDKCFHQQIVRLPLSKSKLR